ncbi:WecB/TagA/CpsF family glycosyltransferase [Ramlibacter sp.]|uniref:WecB/TagA/CpsF family glycosyltransferase n=1 Tax=Ramlibacter sp. TaxID=1917967 RepID=UPI002623DEBE|nr:WecB/TagA/CpsF family glycosyltransferase [Ramlibacter sp.]
MDRKVYQLHGVPVDVLSWTDALGRIGTWAAAGESRSVFACNVHSIVTATQDEVHHEALSRADMVTPDGAPVAWSLRAFTHMPQMRIDGPTLMWRLCEQAASAGTPIFLFGSTDETLAKLVARLRREWPNLRIAGTMSPPFRAMTVQEDEEIIRQINASGAKMLFVGMGCPKQEKWIDAHRGKIGCVMLGVGAAFDYHAGTIKRAPDWVRQAGMEWLFRLAAEPRRLWRRYFYTNSIFIWLSIRSVLSRWVLRRS